MLRVKSGKLRKLCNRNSKQKLQKLFSSPTNRYIIYGGQHEAFNLISFCHVLSFTSLSHFPTQNKRFSPLSAHWIS